MAWKARSPRLTWWLSKRQTCECHQLDLFTEHMNPVNSTKASQWVVIGDCLCSALTNSHLGSAGVPKQGSGSLQLNCTLACWPKVMHMIPNKWQYHEDRKLPHAQAHAPTGHSCVILHVQGQKLINSSGAQQLLSAYCVDASIIFDTGIINPFVLQHWQSC